MTPETWFWVSVFLLCLIVGALKGWLAQDQGHFPEEDRSGWLYFAAAADGPIKVGMTSHEPTQQRLPELGTMSPFPLRLLYKVAVADRYDAEREAHKQLGVFRTHGEWFDRDAVLSYISHLKGEY